MTTSAEPASADPAALCEKIVAAERALVGLNRQINELQRAYARFGYDELMTDDDGPHIEPVIALQNTRHGLADTFAGIDVVAYGLEKARRSAARLHQRT
ncbi:hypothetical protein ONR57_04960 [Hoyosella sp. YIM 151337]|uniref:hypothetical protein n=1 Tax=Hoyosella sp. YIM 151337 TaxID=2992742 RepID=UPI0022367DEE|nr:hypothetical protein [Hoyosella sp. YIM 151337]MCW4352646.1 hypothetical protein [Hoyosella sp. YIM 151337]